MADSQNSSAIDSPTGRLAARLSSFSQFRPQPPRDFRADSATSTLRWTDPHDSVFTHFRLRIDHDDGEPDIEMPDGTHLIQMSFGDRHCLTAFNRSNGMESSPVYVTHTFTGGGSGGSSDCSCGAGFTHIENKTMSADDTVDNTSYEPCNGDMLTWFITFDSSGPWAVTGWDTQYQNAPTTDIDGSPDTMTVVKFVGRASGGVGKWYFAGLETGLTDL